MNDGDLTIKYKDGKGVNIELDREITEILESRDYKYIGSGFWVREGIRDLQFRKGV